MRFNQKIEQALAVIESHGMTDGAHHKQWVIDQVVRALTQERYRAWVETYNTDPIGVDCPGEYSRNWDEGEVP